MATIPASKMPQQALPQPSGAEQVDGCAMAVGNPAQPGLHCSLRDAEVVPELWTMLWADVPAATANAVRAHYRDHAGPFLWAFALRGATETWQHVDEPEITWQPGQQRASVRAVLCLLPARE